MTTLPAGTVTFVFSDIEGSTTLLKQLGEGYGELLAGHRAIVREEFGKHAGVEIDTQGDSFFFAFARARDAVAAAVAAQRRHAEHDWPGGVTVRVRMGLHTGEPAVGSEGYLGVDVVRAARLAASGRGGNVLLSETTRALLGASVPQGVTVHALGERRLKDIDEPERVFELEIEGVDQGPVSIAPASGGPPPPPPPPPAPDGADLDPRTAEFSRRLRERITDSVMERLEKSLDRADRHR